MRGEVAVGRRIPLRVIDSVQDAVEVGGSLPQGSVQAAAEFWRLNLLGICGAHRREQSRRTQCRL